MIRFATEKEFEQIVSLWQEAFGDNADWVRLYLSKHLDSVLVYEEYGQVFGMLSLLPIGYKDKKGYYVYGVATGKEHRSLGISTKLLNFAKDMVGDCGFLVLVPRNQELYDFYGKRGFFALKSVVTKEIKNEDVKFDGQIFPASCEEYHRIRANCFHNLIEWDTDMLCSIKTLENGEYYKAKSGGGAFCCAYNGVLYVKELCGSDDILGSIISLYDVEKIRVTYADKSSAPSCMTYPEFAEDVFFNIYID